VEGRNVAIEYRWADGQYDRLPALAAELVGRQVNVIAATSTPAAAAAKAATTTIPVVFTTGGDPLQLGLVTSLSPPGGNITGATQLNVEVAPKRLELLHELMPTTTTLAFLVNPASSAAVAQSSAVSAAARTLGIDLRVFQAGAERDLETVFAALVQARVQGLVIGSGDALFTDRTKQLAALTVRHSVPAVYQFREFAA